MNFYRYLLHIVINFLAVLSILSLSDIIVEKKIILHSFSLSLSFVIFYFFYLFLIEPKNKMMNRNLEQKIRYVSLVFIYSFVSTFILSQLSNIHINFNFESVILYLFLYLILSVLNIVIYNSSIISLHIHIIGQRYKFTQNDFSILRDLKIEYYIYDSIDSYKNRNSNQENEEKNICVNNSHLNQSSFFTELKNFNEKTIYYDIDDFLESTIRKSLHNDECFSQYNKISYTLKRLIDYMVIIFFIPILLIAIPISYVIVKFQSKGKFIYTQNRIGRNSKLFKMYKIRTMHSNCNDVDILADKDDPRIYQYGKFLRRSRLDELPQFINVMRGEMHIAGPRAEWDQYHDLYLASIDRYELRNVVSPGITGFAQVMFRYAHNEEDSREKLMFDLYYIKNWTIWLEMEIGVKTVLTMVNKKGI